MPTGAGTHPTINIWQYALITSRLHDKTANSYTNCFDGNTWNKSLCPSNTACTTNCAIEGSDYSGTYGITTSGNQLNLKFVTKGQYSTNIGSRTYLMQDTNNYQMFNLIGNEFSFDVDLSQLPCGLNGALYFVSMPQKGQGTPGAKYGTGGSYTPHRSLDERDKGANKAVKDTATLNALAT
jgi:cellulose 1,4-beta-cellobiosidase